MTKIKTYYRKEQLGEFPALSSHPQHRYARADLIHETTPMPPELHPNAKKKPKGKVYVINQGRARERISE